MDKYMSQAALAHQWMADSNCRMNRCPNSPPNGTSGHSDNGKHGNRGPINYQSNAGFPGILTESVGSVAIHAAGSYS